MMMIFVGICFLGAGLLIVSLVLGELFEGGAEMAHDIAVDHTVDFGHAGEVENAGGGPGILSARVIAAFLTGFGGAGALAAHYGKDAIVSSAWGVGAGVAMGAVVLWVARFLFGQQASSGVQVSEMAGKSGQVTIGIPAGGTGQVRFEVKGTLSDFPAQAADGKPVAPGTAVTVGKVVGGTMIVETKT
jgi:hypothetical protein